MAEIRLKENESLDSALRRFKKQCARAGVIQEVRKREAYEKQLASASTNKLLTFAFESGQFLPAFLCSKTV